MRSDEFINYYNLIDEYLGKEGKYDSTCSFSHKVKTSTNKVVNRYRDELISLGELRNAIVHIPRNVNDGKVIAEPHPETVDLIKKLYNEIKNPLKVYPCFTCNVLYANEDDYVNDMLLKIKEKSFSQFPVYNNNGEIIELINTNTIARWLSSHIEENGTILMENVKVKDLIIEIEYKNNYVFLKRTASVYDAYDLFINYIDKYNRNLDVIFITESGNKNEEILGLITIEDITRKINVKFTR